MVVIIGTGIVGAATAYYLAATAPTTTITLIDAVGPAAGASGGAGAFLTNQPPTTTVDRKRRRLFEKSFALHEQLAQELELDSFCPVHTYQRIETIPATAAATAAAAEIASNFSAATSEEEATENATSKRTTTTRTTMKTSARLQEQLLTETKDRRHRRRGIFLPGQAALVDPTEMVSSMLQHVLSLSSNNSFRQATIIGVDLDSSGSRVTALRLDDHDDTNEVRVLPLAPDEPVVIAMGPWSARIEDWFGIPMPIEGVLSTSLIYPDGIQDEQDIGTAFFLDSEQDEDDEGCHLEVFGRYDRSLYVSGCGESEIISTRRLRQTIRKQKRKKEDDHDHDPDRPCCPTVPCRPDYIRAAAAQRSLRKAGYQYETTNHSTIQIQAFLRPVSPDGMPVVGKLLKNVYIGTGGGAWGITWGPLMGQCLASLIKHADDDDTDNDTIPIQLGPISHKRFDTVVYKTLLESRRPLSME